MQKWFLVYARPKVHPEVVPVFWVCFVLMSSATVITVPFFHQLKEGVFSHQQQSGMMLVGQLNMFATWVQGRSWEPYKSTFPRYRR